MSEADREELENTEEEGTNQLAWFITGALVGVTVALLYAPKSGRETRQSIADTAQQGKDAVTGTAKDVAGAGRDMFERGRKVVEDAADLFDRARKLVRG